MKVPNEPGLSPNNGLENVSLLTTVAYLLAWIKITSKARSRGTVCGQGSGIVLAWYDGTSVVNDESIIFS